MADLEEFRAKLARWSSQEVSAIDEIRRRLDAKIAARTQYPEVVGDRKILRFLRGHNFDIDKVTEMFSKFLTWRTTNNIDRIREEIASGVRGTPTKFPKADLIAPLIKSVVITPDKFDVAGCPICVDTYNFSPSVVLKAITVPEYIHYFTYCLEYRSMTIEQLSEQREREKLKELKDRYDAGDLKEADLKALPPYGIIVQTLVIRDLSGLGMEHIGSQGREIIRSVIGLSADNYPEMMGKCYMINTPWLFNTLWYFVKGLLAQRTIDKVAIIGTSFIPELQKRVSLENLPTLIVGGKLSEISNTVFEVDVGGCLAVLGGPIISNESSVSVDVTVDISPLSLSASTESAEMLQGGLPPPPPPPPSEDWDPTTASSVDGGAPVHEER